jgi:hypothetical protein
MSSFRTLRRRLLSFVFLLQCGATILLLGAPSASAANAPQFQIRIYGQPTHMAPGETQDTFYVHLTNVGNAPTSPGETVVVADQVSAGAKVTSIEFFAPGISYDSFAGRTGNGVELAEEFCTSEPIHCEYPHSQLLPGESLELFVNVEIEPGATAPITDSVAVSGGGAPSATASTANAVSQERAPFGLERVEISAHNSGGTSFAQAAGHPFLLTTGGYLDSWIMRRQEGPSTTEAIEIPQSVEHPEDIYYDLPPGLLANPQAVTKCTLSQFWLEQVILGGEALPGCPASSQVGTMTTEFQEPGIRTYKGYQESIPLYNLDPSFGYPAMLAYSIGGFAPVIAAASLRTGTDYGVRIATEGIPGVDLMWFQVNAWGVPWESVHNGQRGQACLSPGPDCYGGDETAPSKPMAYLRMPTSCSAAPLTTNVLTDSWEVPGVFSSVSTSMPPADGCNAVQFEPSLQARPTTPLADSPSGLDVDLHLRQENENPRGTATADLKDATIALPAGLSLNPSAAWGLQGCSEQQVGYRPATSEPFEFTPAPAVCPGAAKLGSVEVVTPPLDHPLPGALYLAQPHDNPFGSLLAAYLTVDDPQTGVVVKLAGKIQADPQTGQLTTTFEENPQLPFEDVRIHIFGGAQGALRTPSVCGTYSSTAALTPWSAPESPTSPPPDEFAIAGNCASSEAAEPNSPTFHAGTESPQAGKFSPFAFKLHREDGSQEFSKIETTLPPGLVGKLAGVAECPESAIAQAKSREHDGGGAEEQASPSCPLASEVGTVDVGAGAGPDPFYTTGHAYLAGPYEGAPLSLVIVTQAVAGPFDLGAVVVRTPLYVNPETAQINAKSDPIPHIIDGIPLDIRSVTLKMNRPNFTLNPTSCNALAFGGSLTSVLGQSAPLSQRFQAVGCSAMPFKPKLSLSLKGKTNRTAHPALTAVLTMKPGQANIAGARVTLPHSEFLDQSHIVTVCTRVQFAAHACPKGSLLGSARAITPLLERPLEGPVYLRSSSHELPDLVADLNGQIDVVLDGHVDSVDGRLRNTFEVVPDAPVSKFTLSLQGGSKGLLQNSTDLCASTNRAIAEFTGQNGKASDTEPVVKSKCPKSHKHRGKGHRGHRKRRG